MPLESRDWERIHQGLLPLYRERDREEHGRVMMNLIMEFVSADSVAINCLDITTGGYTMQVAPEGLWSLETVEAIRPNLHESPFPAYHLATGDDRWKMTTDFMPLEDFRETGLYRSLRCWNVEMQMCALLAIVNHTAHAITVHRTSGGFEERDREILDVLHPHLVTSYLNAMAFEQADRSLGQFRCLMDQAPGAYGYLERDGKLGWLQPKAVVWLNEFFPEGKRTQDGLPVEIYKMALELSATGRDAVHLETPGAVSGLFVCVAVSPMGGWMLRLEKRPHELPPRFRDLAQFSKRVNEVLRWMVEGKRNGEIATILGISPRTVEKHVSVILESLGVENRATAIVRAMEVYGRSAYED